MVRSEVLVHILYPYKNSACFVDVVFSPSMSLPLAFAAFQKLFFRCSIPLAILYIFVVTFPFNTPQPK